MKRLEQIEAEIRRLEDEASLEYEREQKRQRQQLEAEEKEETRRIQEEFEEIERKEQEKLQGALQAMRQRCEWEERLRAGILPPIPRTPLTCYQPTTGKLGTWGLCKTFVMSFAGESQPSDVCIQCARGYRNEYWSSGLARRELGRVAY